MLLRFTKTLSFFSQKRKNEFKQTIKYKYVKRKNVAIATYLSLPPNGMAAMRQILLKEKIIIIKRLQ